MKSQFFSIEAIISIGLFMAIFGIMIFIISEKSNDFLQSTQNDYLIIHSNNIINMLSLSGGYPYFWNESNFSQIGLCDYPKIINNAKLDSFINLLNENESMIIESFGIEAYKIYFSLEYLNGTKIIEYKPKGMPRNVMVSKRKVLLNDSSAIMKVGVLN